MRLPCPRATQLLLIVITRYNCHAARSTTDLLMRLTCNKGRWTVTGACGPYNLGGSTTELYQRDHYKIFVVLVYKNLKMIWDD